MSTVQTTAIGVKRQHSLQVGEAVVGSVSNTERPAAVRWVSWLSLACLWLAGLGAAFAEPLPVPNEVAERLQREPVAVQVRHAHDGLGELAPVLAYYGFPANEVLDALLGAAWRESGREVEFVAADGYRSVIPSAHFARYRAWLVYAPADGAAFVTDNVFKNRREVSLGPWYLVWDNLAAPQLMAFGDHYWPYQVVAVAIALPHAQ